ncbi:hypothetical protein DdX_17425 [Ditylenchus destructor]|uniref:Uncharacterized protein n=1 Tax=Ditylenchus destructor TaxID=166010 RepID=A0AAD4MLF5_9BILA|nr:hypothetical protein DdX_17425 [Ditylenchus destructor]
MRVQRRYVSDWLFPTASLLLGCRGITDSFQKVLARLWGASADLQRETRGNVGGEENEEGKQTGRDRGSHIAWENYFFSMSVLSSRKNQVQFYMDYMQKRRHWFVCLCFRLIFVFAVLGFTYSMPHLTPSISAFWISVTVTHIPECRKFSSWMNYWTSSELCLQYSDHSHGPNCKCPLIQGMFTILVSIPHFATLFATFLTFLPEKAIKIPSFFIFIFLSAIAIQYKHRHETLYGLCFGAITTLFPGLYPDRIRHNNDCNSSPSENFYFRSH